jgi:hypothetical protein
VGLRGQVGRPVRQPASQRVDGVDRGPRIGAGWQSSARLAVPDDFIEGVAQPPSPGVPAHGAFERGQVRILTRQPVQLVQHRLKAIDDIVGARRRGPQPWQRDIVYFPDGPGEQLGLVQKIVIQAAARHVGGVGRGSRCGSRCLDRDRWRDGPNTNQGGNSTVYIPEAGARLVASAVGRVAPGRLRGCAAGGRKCYNDRLFADLERTVWIHATATSVRPAAAGLVAPHGSLPGGIAGHLDVAGRGRRAQLMKIVE